MYSLAHAISKIRGRPSLVKLDASESSWGAFADYIVPQWPRNETGTFLWVLCGARSMTQAAQHVAKTNVVVTENLALDVIVETNIRDANLVAFSKWKQTIRSNSPSTVFTLVSGYRKTPFAYAKNNGNPPLCWRMAMMTKASVTWQTSVLFKLQRQDCSL